MLLQDWLCIALKAFIQICFLHLYLLLILFSVNGVYLNWIYEFYIWVFVVMNIHNMEIKSSTVIR